MKILTAVLATLVVSTQVPAAEPERDPKAIQAAQLKFASLDRDGDHQLSRAEVDGALTARFASVDANDDGSIDESEYISHTAIPSDQRDRGIRDQEILDPFDPTNPARE